jgi:hypothetical protein
MALARLRKAGALLVASLLVVLMAAPGADGACNATCQRDMERCMATQCEGVAPQVCRRRCKPAAIRTLAYVVAWCQRDVAGGNQTGGMDFRVRRGDRDPITVVSLPSYPQPGRDSQQLCRNWGESRSGGASIVVIPMQRFGVSPDGSRVVFELNESFSLTGLPLPVGWTRGMYSVRSDGRGLRYLGPATRDPPFIVHPDVTGTFVFVVNMAQRIAFSPNGHWIAFTDRAPGPGGDEAVQIVALDLATGARRQVTHLPPGSPPDPSAFVTAYPYFIDDTIGFGTYTNPDGSNPEHQLALFTVRIDGSRLRQTTIPSPVAGSGGWVLPRFGVATFDKNVFTLSVPGTPLNNFPGQADPISEVFTQNRGNLIQITNFHRVDTALPVFNVARDRILFRASADLGANP